MLSRCSRPDYSDPFVVHWVELDCRFKYLIGLNVSWGRRWDWEGSTSAGSTSAVLLAQRDSIWTDSWCHFQEGEHGTALFVHDSRFFPRWQDWKWHGLANHPDPLRLRRSHHRPQRIQAETRWDQTKIILPHCNTPTARETITHLSFELAFYTECDEIKIPDDAAEKINRQCVFLLRCMQ